MTDLSTIRMLQKKYGFYTKKKFGQNFLLNEQVVEQVIQGANIGLDDVVVEIGPGMGTMTNSLGEAAKAVLAVEIDEKLKPLLAETVPMENVELLFQDVMKIDLDQEVMERFGAKQYKVVANLPYYITTPIIMKLLEKQKNISSITVMTQKEVAERMQANPGGKEYGALSVAVRYYASAEVLTTVGPQSFYPAPKVDSAVIGLTIRNKPPVEVLDEVMFFSVLKGAFQQRRKTLLNALSHNLGFITKDELREMLVELGIEAGRRGETLAIEEFASLSNRLYQFKNSVDNQ
ncbi:16S rRNA (adenine(1518)-N(6)/adenine(1519)-N(6))-dimethyltransferase RsmA [Clostridia bacterium]|nr:16S rRNA (adenine(1518)-N(6)/adenine(1519)-N(6))-dimethyltransferase RsmA [Clostridia bacterium]